MAQEWFEKYYRELGVLNWHQQSQDFNLVECLRDVQDKWVGCTERKPHLATDQHTFMGPSMTHAYPGRNTALESCYIEEIPLASLCDCICVCFEVDIYIYFNVK